MSFVKVNYKGDGEILKFIDCFIVRAYPNRGGKVMAHSDTRDTHRDTHSASGDWARLLGSMTSVKEFRQFHWEGGFNEYLDIVKKNPGITRNAFQRIYDMILSWGTSSYVEYK